MSSFCVVRVSRMEGCVVCRYARSPTNRNLNDALEEKPGAQLERSYHPGWGTRLRFLDSGFQFRVPGLGARVWDWVSGWGVHDLGITVFGLLLGL